MSLQSDQLLLGQEPGTGYTGTACTGTGRMTVCSYFYAMIEMMSVEQITCVTL